MIEYCISAFRERQDEKAFKFYVTEALRLMTENTGRMIRDGLAMNKRFVDMIDRTPPPPPDTRNCEEITADIWARAKIGRKKDGRS